MRPLHVAGIQTGPGGEDIAQNVARGLGLLEAAAAGERLDLAVFDELFNLRFFPVDRLDRFDQYFETIPGPTTELLAEAARRHSTNIVAGIAERSAAGQYYNSAVVLDRRGQVVGVYRKTHVPLMAAPEDRATYERNYFRPGDDLPIFQLDCATLGVLICYDRHFPEAWRTLALRGAEIVAVPTGARSWNRSWRSGIWEALLRTMAYVNGVFVLGVNRAGIEERTTYTGDSMLVSPVGGQILQRAQEGAIDCVVAGVIDLDDIVRCAETIPFRRDLRPDLYCSG
jgi:predicted amidohydrolase